MVYGISCGWPSPNLPLLMSDDSPLPTGKLSIDEISWISGLICIGGIAGNLFFGYIMNNYGRKEPLIVIAVPTIVISHSFNISNYFLH